MNSDRRGEKSRTAQSRAENRGFLGRTEKVDVTKLLFYNVRPEGRGARGSLNGTELAVHGTRHDWDE